MIECVKEILRKKQRNPILKKVTLLEVRDDSSASQHFLSQSSTKSENPSSLKEEDLIVMLLKDFKVEDWGDGSVNGRYRMSWLYICLSLE